MKITQIDATHLLIFYSTDELDAPPETISAAHARDLISTALHTLGITYTGNIKITAYIKESGLLLDTELCDTALMLRFSTLKKTISAAHTLNSVCAPPMIVIYCENSYYLLIYAHECTPKLSALCKQFDRVYYIDAKHSSDCAILPEYAVNFLVKWFHI